ncbi:MAG: 4Fe-4S binding protein, partial [bacterium]|nr:4Fe-4S binding protein [bacterium]
MAPIQVIEDKCIGCKKCVKVCPFGAIEMRDRLAVIDLSKCTLCGACVEPCPVEAIVLDRGGSRAGAADDSRGVWVFAEQRGGEIQSVVFELLGAGRRLAAARGCELAAVLIGSGVEAQAGLLFRRGADKVCLLYTSPSPRDS